MKTKLPQLPQFRLTADHILYSIAGANAVRIAWAYAYADASGNLLSPPGAAGALLGVSLSFGTAFVAGKLPGLVRKPTRMKMTSIALGLILALEPVVLAPITLTHMPSALKSTLPSPLDGLWSVALALLPSLLLAGLSFANGSMIEGTTTQPAPATTQPAPATTPAKASEPEPAPATAESLPCPHAGAGCDKVFVVSDYKSLKAAQNAANAHAGRCSFKDARHE
jgi:hypothetical protein